MNTGRAGWTRIFNNLFDNNRHDIAANGRAGGYDALDNLLLRGGGYHGAWYEAYTHVVDAHGTGCWWSSDLYGEAGRDFLIKENVIQYTRNSDIHIRGAPRGLAVIDENRFARSLLALCEGESLAEGQACKGWRLPCRSGSYSTLRN